MAWKKTKTKSSLILPHCPLRRAGATVRSRRSNVSSPLSCRQARPMLRDGRRRSRIRGRNSGCVHQQDQKIVESEWFFSENKGELTWQLAKRKTRKTRKGILR